MDRRARDEATGRNYPRQVPDVVTWTIAQLTDWVNAVIGETLGGEIWIEGEISNLQRSNAGHVYFTLTEPADEAGGRAPNTLAVTLFEWHRQNVNRHLRRSGGAVRISDGVRVRIRGSVEVYGARSQLQLKMSGIDPVFTLGNMAAERALLLARLDGEGLLRANAALPLEPVPLRIAVVTSIGSAAHADAMHELGRGGIGFDLVVVDTRVQGADAPASIVAALGRAAAAGVDLIALVRGGGARTDLAAFDEEIVARAVASSPVPVWTGLGHEIDRTVADEVAHRSWKTPTACAAAVVELVVAGAQQLDDLWSGIEDATARRLERSAIRLDRLASRTARTALADLDRSSSHLAGAAHRVRRLADAHVIRGSARTDDARRRLVAAAPRAIGDQGRRLDAIAATVRAYDPAVSLARGWSITRGADGRVVRAADLDEGDVLVTQVADGRITSVVTASSSGIASDGATVPGT
jgi:exodeoxyribonuclease VII large subunit